MICPYCGKENPDDLEICGFCGGPLLSDHQPVPEVKPVEPPVDIIQQKAESEEPEFGPAQPAKPPTSRLYGGKIWWITGCIVFICLVLACIAVVIGAYRYTKLFSFLNPTQEAQTTDVLQIDVDTPLPVLSTQVSNLSTQSLSQTSSVLFFDDFSDPGSGWDQVDETNYSTNYYNDTYRIKINDDMSDSWANPSNRKFSDVIIEADATKNGGPDDNDFGLICRYQDTQHYYYAVISSDGYYGIFKVTSESTDILGRDNMEYSDYIKQGLMINTIRFECVGESLTLYVNSQLLDQQTDNEYSTGNVGLIAGTYDTPGTDILFDNFTVYSP